MKTLKSSAEPKLKVQLKLKKDGKYVYSQVIFKINRFNHIVDGQKWDKAYLRVTYLPNVYNDGWYEKRVDLLKAKSQFLEKNLVDFAYSKNWTDYKIA